MSPNLNSDHHYIFCPIPDSWIAKAKKIKFGEDIKYGRDHQRFDSNNRWAGKIGEWSFYALYSFMKPVTSDYSPTEFDFLSPKTNLRYDPKLDYENRPFENHLHAYVDANQVSENSANIIVFLYWCEKEYAIRFCGWLYKYQIEYRGTFYRKGQIPESHKTPTKNACWLISYKDINAMSVMPDSLKIGT